MKASGPEMVLLGRGGSLGSGGLVGDPADPKVNADDWPLPGLGGDGWLAPGRSLTSVASGRLPGCGGSATGVCSMATPLWLPGGIRGASYGAPLYTGIGAPESCISLRRASLSRSVMASDKAGMREIGAALATSGGCFGIPQTPPLPEVLRRPSSRIFRGITSCLRDDILASSSRRVMPSADRP